MEYHNSIISGLQDQYNKLQDRIDRMYVDKLDGKISEDFWQQKSAAWRQEQSGIAAKIESHQNANCSYLAEGIRILELANNAYFLYVRQNPAEKRKLLNYVLSNCILKGGELTPTYRQPFDLIAQTVGADEKKRAENKDFSARNEIWLPAVFSFTNFISFTRKVVSRVNYSSGLRRTIALQTV